MGLSELEIRFYTGNLIDPATTTGVVEVGQAPVLNVVDALMPRVGMLGYHRAAGWSLAMDRAIIEARQKRLILCPIEVTLSGMNRSFPDGKEINVATMKPDEVEHCELMHLGRVSSEVGSIIGEVLRKGYTKLAAAAESSLDLSDDAVRSEQAKLLHLSNQALTLLSKVNTIPALIDFVCKHPRSVDMIHDDPMFKHMNIIQFPTGPIGRSVEYMTSMINANPNNLSIKTFGNLPSIQLVIPERFLSTSKVTALESVKGIQEDFKPS